MQPDENNVPASDEDGVSDAPATESDANVNALTDGSADSSSETTTDSPSSETTDSVDSANEPPAELPTRDSDPAANGVVVSPVESQQTEDETINVSSPDGDSSPLVEQPSVVSQPPSSDTDSVIAPVVTPLAPDTSQSDAASTVVSSPPPTSNSGNGRGRRSVKISLKTLLIGLVILAVIGGGVAFALVDIIIPNEPANVLETALGTSLDEPQASFTGNVEGAPVTGTGLAYKATLTGAEDAATKAVDAQLNLTVSGISFPLEARLVNKNFYFKVGNLSTLTGLVSSLSPADKTLVDQLSSELTNKWFVVDSTLLNEAGLGSVLNTSWTLSNANLQTLENDYTQNRPLTILSSTSTTLNGVAVDKMVVTLSAKAPKFVQTIASSNLSFAKSIKTLEKDESTANASSSSAITANENGPITLWINKNTKEIVQLQTQTTAQAAKKANNQTTLTLNFNYNPVSITAPTGAEPVLNLLPSLESALGASGTSTL